MAHEWAYKVAGLDEDDLRDIERATDFWAAYFRRYGRVWDDHLEELAREQVFGERRRRKQSKAVA